MMSRALTDSPATANPQSTARAATVGLLLIGLIFLIWRLPSMYREPGWQDEDCYAAPGLTILESGIPRFPHLPSRDPNGPYFHADEVLFVQPPLFFYAQAVLYSFLPQVYGTARLVSAIAGVLLLFLGGRLCLRCGGGMGVALWGMGLYMMSRWFYFPAITARPDLPCTTFGLMAVLAVAEWTRSRSRLALIGAAAAIGLGGLTHPFALAYAVQMAVWTCLTGRRWERLLAPLTLAIGALLVASVWLLLIRQNPEIFAVQFRNQLWHSRGGTLLGRVFWPWESLSFHAALLWPHIGSWQFFLAGAGAALCLFFGRREKQPLLITTGWLAISGVVLICMLVGAHHPIFGYFSYPAVLSFVGIGWGADRLLTAVAAHGRLGRVAAATLAAACVLSFVFGSRVRMNLAYLQNWDSLYFNSPRFAQSLIDRLPADATFIVDEEFSLDFLAAGRKVLVFRAVDDGLLPADNYDYRVSSRSTVRYPPRREWNDQLMFVAGNPDEPYGCFARVYCRRCRAADIGRLPGADSHFAAVPEPLAAVPHR